MSLFAVVGNQFVQASSSSALVYNVCRYNIWQISQVANGAAPSSLAETSQSIEGIMGYLLSWIEIEKRRRVLDILCLSCSFEVIADEGQ